MARTKKRSYKRKTTTGPKKRVSISGITYQHVSCSTSKTTAAKAAKAVREKEGRLARVVKNGKMFCIYKGRKRKTTTKKK